MVGREDLMNAIALNSSMFNSARIIGPAIAGILVAKIGEGWCFFANGISYIAVIAGLFLMQVNPFRPAAPTMSAWHTIREGFRYVGGTMPIRAIVQILAIISFAGLPYTVLMPIFADRILHGGAQALGVLMGATGLGALVGALLIASRTGLKGFMVWIPVAAGGFAVALAGFSVIEQYVAFLRDAVRGRLLGDDSGGGVEYLDPVDRAGSSARAGDERLFDDVYRDRAGGGDGGGIRGRGNRGADDDSCRVRRFALRQRWRLRCGCP